MTFWSCPLTSYNIWKIHVAVESRNSSTNVYKGKAAQSKRSNEPSRGKTNNVVSEQVRHKPACTITEKSWKLEISDLCRRGIVLSLVAETKALVSYCEADLRQAKFRLSHGSNLKLFNQFNMAFCFVAICKQLTKDESNIDYNKDTLTNENGLLKKNN